MCGIIAVLPARSSPPSGTWHSLLVQLDSALDALRAAVVDAASLPTPHELSVIREQLEAVDSELRGASGAARLLSDAELGRVEQLVSRTGPLEEALTTLELRLDADPPVGAPSQIEALNGEVTKLRDVVWSICNDRAERARGVSYLLAGSAATPAAIDAFWAIDVALSALDRLEVRGRDSAGVHILLTGHQLDLSNPYLRSRLEPRSRDGLFQSGAIRILPLCPGSTELALSFVYKVAAEIGNLGDNVRALRADIRNDSLLHLALESAGGRVTVLGHTRWASVGLVSEANAHPLNGEEWRTDSHSPLLNAHYLDDASPTDCVPDYVVAALNGDIDNYVGLTATAQLSIAPDITTDSKVLPTLISRRLAGGATVEQAFVSTVARLEGSVAVALSAAQTPDELHLALRGSGQALYVGLAREAFVVASEPSGLVEETSSYVRMEGAPSGDAGPGQLVILNRVGAGTIGALRRLSYTETSLPVGKDDIREAEVTTRDIDRRGFDHFLLKELHEAPRSFQKTLRGKIFSDGPNGLLTVHLDERTIPASIRSSLQKGEIRRILAIGQGTAGVAAEGVAAAVAHALRPVPLVVSSLLATELSGYGLAEDMADTLLVVVSQSGTTTDTNRTVDVARQRGAQVIAIVNRRSSDLVEKADGVMYTSDGRDIEMSVASTKAFYSQVGAGFLLALALAREMGCHDPRETDSLLRGLRELPSAMEAILGMRELIAKGARTYAPSRRHWAIVGSGPNRVAAAEIRIKLSELCYKAIACDATEDKKHIDLSSEPLIFVCAAGVTGPIADDIGKEIAIFRAHRAAPIVVATTGKAQPFSHAAQIIEVPEAHPAIAWVLSTMVGHIFGYECALSIDALSRPLREARAAVEACLVGGELAKPMPRLRTALETASTEFFRDLHAGRHSGVLDARAAVRLSSLFHFAIGDYPVESYEGEFGRMGSPEAILQDLIAALSVAIADLTRSIDAIKHQAKTVTVGISRSEVEATDVPLVTHLTSVGTSVSDLSYEAIRTLASLSLAVARVDGITRYRIDGDVELGDAKLAIVGRSGVSRQLRSRAEDDPRLLGTKHRVAVDRAVLVAQGRRDGRTLVLVPETRGTQVTGLTLLHVAFHEYLPAPAARELLAGYRNRYGALVDAVTETEVDFVDAPLATIPTLDLLVQSVDVLAEAWRQPRL